MIAGASSWPVAEPLETARLHLLPLRIEDAEEAAGAFDDPRLHEFTGGRPATSAQLRTRYSHQVSGRSPDGSQGWLNWIVRERETDAIVGTVQATLQATRIRTSSTIEAELAWVVAVPAQGLGFAREAAGAVVDWLSARGVTSYLAHINPAHHASAAVAAALGLHPTDTVLDGEVEWRRSV
ncbi:GNAT family N-acetyltransferase [soil metagenome]